jgi:OTU domain-containing protein 6
MQEKREREERERQERIDEAKASSGPNLRVIEEEKLLAQLKPLNFGIKEIIPDGHCLYAALGDQLGIKFGVKLPVEELRRRCADHMRSNNEEFMPFAVDHETGDPCSRDTFVKYCEDVEKTAVWGGHLEIRALSRVFNVAVSVFQADLPVLWIGEEHKENGILYLTYHHHAYGLGEHYNSVTPLS